MCNGELNCKCHETAKARLDEIFQGAVQMPDTPGKLDLLKSLKNGYDTILRKSREVTELDIHHLARMVEELPDGPEKSGFMERLQEIFKELTGRQLEGLEHRMETKSVSTAPSDKRSIDPNYQHLTTPEYAVARSPIAIWGLGKDSRESWGSRTERLAKEKSSTSDTVTRQLEEEERAQKEADFTPPRINETDFARRTRLMAESWNLPTNEHERAYTRQFEVPIDMTGRSESQTEFAVRTKRILESGFERNG